MSIGSHMTTVTISKNFKVTIPREIRRNMQINPGQKFQVIFHKNRIELIILREIQSMRGFLKEIKTNIERY